MMNSKLLSKGYKQTKVGVIPEDWEIVNLNEKTLIQRGKFSPRPRNDPKYYNGEYPFIQTNEIVHSKGKIKNYSQTLNDKGLKVSRLFPKGTILMTIAANIGFTGIITIDMACPDSLVGIQCHKDVNNEYLNFYFMYIQRRIDYLAEKVAQKNINLSTLNNIKIPLPPLKEQQKIAKILSTWDNAIEKQEQLIEQKELLKKGLMQRLLSKKWKAVKIGDILTIGSGKDYKHLKNGDIPVYGTGGYMLSVNEYLHDGESVCIGRKGTIDKPIFLEGKFWTVDTLFYTHSYKNTIPKFLYFYFLQINWKKYNEASGVPSLSKKTIETIKIKLPSLLEQQKIAKILSLADKEIALLKEELSELKNQKKALMQKLLTGEMRVSV